MPNDTAFLNGANNQTQEYLFSARATDGRELEQALTASSPDMATLQSWDVIQQHQRNGTDIQTARIEWSTDEGPQVSHIYDRRQGFEISKPDGVDLQNNPAAHQLRNVEDSIRQQSKPVAPALEHHGNSPANRQHQDQHQQQNSTGFSY